MGDGNRKRKTIRETTKLESGIVREAYKPREERGDGIIIDFSNPFSFYCCKLKGGYSNYYKSQDEFVKFRKKLFGDGLVYFKKSNFDELLRNVGTSHTHKIEDIDKVKLIKSVLCELIERQRPGAARIDMIVDQYLDADIWQIGCPQGIRLIGTRDNNILVLLFIDCNHLIWPDEKHNNKDYKSFNYCPMTS